MNKAALLADLAARVDYVSWVGAAFAVPDTPTEEDGAVLWRVKYRNLSGVAGGYLNQDFWLWHAGQGDELAFYRDAPPMPRARPSALKEWMIAAIALNPNNYKGFAVIWLSERFEMVVYSTFEGAAPHTRNYWYVRKGQGVATAIVATTPAAVANFISELKSSLLQV